MNSDRFDVAIIGAGPAGAIAAAYLAGKKHSVALIDSSDFASEPLRLAWLSAKAMPILNEIGSHSKGRSNDSIRELTFYSSDFSKSSRTQFEEPAGQWVERTAFARMLRDTAIKAGANFLSATPLADIRLNEKDNTLTLNDQRKLTSRLLIVATGGDSTFASRIGFRMDPLAGGLWTAQVDSAIKTSSANPAQIAVVLGLDSGSGFGWCGTWDQRAVVNVNLPQHRERAVEYLRSVCKFSFQHNLVPVDLSEAAAKSVVRRSPAGGALDMETHVAKHSLIIGEAGGFVSAANNESLYPAIWSAKLAAETVEEALRSKFSQDALMSFDSKWRMQMADYLRSPHTDVRFLLPLIFSNQPMADRMGAAFLLGSNI